VNSRQCTHTHTRARARARTVDVCTIRCFFIDWGLMESSRLHAAVRKVSNYVTYLITLSNASLSYYKFTLELFDRTAYEYANSFTADAVSCFLINLHVIRSPPPPRPMFIFKVSFFVSSTPPVALFPRFVWRCPS
jgi:hypothetical protein